MNKKRIAAALLAAAALVPMHVLAEAEPEATQRPADSIFDVDYSTFRLEEPSVAYVKTTEPGAVVNLRWAPSRDAAVQHRMYDGDEAIVYAVGDGWTQIMDSESGYIGFIQSEFLTTEEPALATLAEAEEGKPFLDFDIKMDKVPEGYSYTTEEKGGNLYATFSSEDPEALTVYVSVSYSPVFSGYTLKSDLSVAEFEAAKQELIVDYNDPTVELRETEYGTALFTVTEGDAQTAYADMIMVWEGYIIRVNLQKPTELTEEDMELATQIASDMWVVEQ